MHVCGCPKEQHCQGHVSICDVIPSAENVRKQGLELTFFNDFLFLTSYPMAPKVVTQAFRDGVIISTTHVLLSVRLQLGNAFPWPVWGLPLHPRSHVWGALQADH